MNPEKLNVRKAFGVVLFNLAWIAWIVHVGWGCLLLAAIAYLAAGGNLSLDGDLSVGPAIFGLLVALVAFVAVGFVIPLLLRRLVLTQARRPMR